jgi:small redox-active disulfide protein 2
MIRIEVIGLGCPKCATLANRVRTAAEELGLEYQFEKVSDLGRIIEVGVPVPALVVNGRVAASGVLPSLEEIKRLLLETIAA